MKSKIILASASPRRQELLKQVGLSFQVDPSHCEEKITKQEPDEMVKELSCQKAKDVAVKYAALPQEEGLLVIGADTVVSCDGKILGKPESKEDAVRMLTMLSGRSHKVYTGVTLLYRENAQSVWEETCFAECTQVTFYPMTQKEIERYVESGEPMDKAGSYGIQGKCAAFIEKIDGDYNNVVGLPVASVCLWLRKRGIFEELV